MYEKLSTKFFIYKSEADNGKASSFQKIKEQEILISTEAQTLSEDPDSDKKQQSKSHPLQQLNYFADTWSILRFIKGNKSQGV